MPIVYRFPSRSSDAVHTVTVEHGRITCTCRGFSTPSRCWHVREVAEKEGINLAHPVSTTPSLFGDDAPQANGFIEPMLARALPDGQTIDDYASDDYILEEKYDGHRLIVRLSAGEVFAFSRAAKTRVLPPHLREALRLVAPGTYDGELYIPGHTSTDVTRVDRQHQLRLVLFDILNVDGAHGAGRNTIDIPGHERRLLLEEAVSLIDHTDVVFAAPRCAVSDAGLQEIWDRGGEGAIIKRVNARYRPGKRVPEWIKFKKQQAATVRITGFKAGKYGPHSVICGTDSEGIEVQVKSRNDEWRHMFAVNPSAYIGRLLVISYQVRTRDGRYRHPMADHFLAEE